MLRIKVVMPIILVLLVLAQIVLVFNNASASVWIEVRTDKRKYDPGETVKIYGKVYGSPTYPIQVGIEVVRTNDSAVIFRSQVWTDDEGNFRCEEFIELLSVS